MSNLKRWAEVVSIISGKNQKAVVNPYGQYPIYGSGGLIGYADDYLCEAGTTIVGRKGTINKPIFVTERFWNVDTAFGVSPGKALVPKYLFYFCEFFNFQALDKSTTIPSLSKSDLLKIEMPVPPIPEQQRIVSRIEELLSQLDSGVETLNTVKRQLAAYRHAVLKEAFSAFCSDVPFGEIMTSNLGKMLDKAKNQGTPRKYIRNANVRWFSFDLSDLLEMRISDKETERYSVQSGDLVICEGGEPGRCAVWNSTDSIFFQKALHRVRFKKPCNPKFYMYYFWFAAQSDVLKHYVTGSGIKHLTGDSLKKIPVPFADISRQNAAVRDIEARLSVCDNIEQTVADALRQSEAMRQSILKRAFEGEL